MDCSFLLLSSSNKYTPFIQRGGYVAFVIRYCFVAFEKGLVRIPLPKITVTAPVRPVLVAPALPPFVFSLLLAITGSLGCLMNLAKHHVTAGTNGLP